jgi:hypothetical protein
MKKPSVQPTDLADSVSDDDLTLERLLDDAVVAGHEELVWPRLPAGASIVGACVDDRHPSIVGRVCVRWEDDEGKEHQRWCATTMNLPVRTGDRVILTQPINWPELVITGVLDGFAQRPAVDPAEKAQLELKPDEVMVVADHRGRPLIEIRAGEAGPTIRLRQPGLALETDEHLELRADWITIESKKGPVRITSVAHVVIEGDHISLN